MTKALPILIIGLSDAGAAGLPAALRDRLHAAELLVGGARHLAAFADFRGETLSIGADAEPALERLALAWRRGERAVLLASGDPMWYGIGASLRRALPPEALEVLPAPTAAQLAFAALGEPWAGAALLSAHARPLGPVVAAALSAPLAAILTDGQRTPPVIAAALIDAGMPPTTPCAVCENLGGPRQRIVRASLEEAAAGSFAPLNVFVVWNSIFSPQSRRERRASYYSAPTTHHPSPTTHHPPGLPDESFATEAGQITKREVRLLSLAELGLAAGELLWDVGAGSGAVGIEAARSQPSARIFAIERRAVFLAHIAENLRRLPAPNLTLVAGEAPEACAELPAPDAVFIGGSGGRLAAIVALARARLSPGGRLVINLATLENLHEARQLLPEARISQVQISRGQPIQDMLRFEALNPIWIVTWRKD